MVLVLQLDDDGNPSGELDGSLFGAATSAHANFSARRAAAAAGLNGAAGKNVTDATGSGDDDGADGGLSGFQPPPAYSSLSATPSAHLHPNQQQQQQQQQRTQFRLDQTWGSPPRTGEDRTISLGFGYDGLPPRFSELTVSDGQTISASGVGKARESSGDMSSVQAAAAAATLASLLRAYPVVISLVCHLDQTDISSLAQTCRRVRSGLLQFRGQVLAHTLRCVRESTPRDPTSLAPSRWCPPCARDLVAPCRCCGQTVCRNCTAKQADILRTTQRHRRLCRTCQTGPLDLLGLDLGHGPALANDGAHSTGEQNYRTAGSTYRAGGGGGGGGPCICASTGVHICRSCDGSQNGPDITYTRGWSWRSRYRNLGFGLGTGVGEGSAGVKCGRGSACLAARDLIVDMDCPEVLRSVRSRNMGGSNATQSDVATALLIGGGGIGSGHVERSVEDTPPTPSTPLTPMVVDSGILDAAGSGIGTASSPGRPSATQTNQLSHGQAGQSAGGNASSASIEDDPHAQGGKHESAGYHRQEIEGIGGVVKKKLKKRVRVGATVTEYEDESQTGAFLERERTGAMRSWCAWCDRVIPSLADVEMIKNVRKGSLVRDAL